MPSNVANKFVVFIAVLTLAGCGSSTPNEPASKDDISTKPGQASSEMNDSTAGKAGEISTSSESDQTSIPALADDGFEPYTSPGTIKWQGEDVRNAKIPSQLPVYDNATRVSGSSSPRRFVFEWASTDPKKDVMAFFRQELPRSGYEIKKEESYGVFEATRQGEALSVWIGSPPNKPISILVRLEYE